LAAARALAGNTELSAHDIALKSLHIAASICVFTNDNIYVEDL
ncbi:MAG: HslU--HslV peptidase proteolytic subunit, partial [Clostridia bacterium]|nr:HslU--HslV peptidase proteolytic subunit [Clostridia bacterium]